MNKDNKLFQSILQSGQTQADGIIAEAKEEAKRLIQDAEKRAAAEEKETLQAAKAQAERIRHSAKSNASLLTRNAALNAKRSGINSAVAALAKHINALPAEDYFALLYRAAAAVSGSYEEIFLNARDLERVPADFMQQLEKAGVKAVLSKEPAAIDGGFLLKDGAIETNCSFSALIEDKRSEIEDFINPALFERKGE